MPPLPESEEEKSDEYSIISSNKKTALVCFFSGNITRLVFLAGKPTAPQVESVSQAKKTMSVIFPLKKHMTVVFCLSHATNKHAKYPAINLPAQTSPDTR
jgi:hypothetical protein